MGGFRRGIYLERQDLVVLVLGVVVRRGLGVGRRMVGGLWLKEMDVGDRNAQR